MERRQQQPAAPPTIFPGAAATARSEVAAKMAVRVHRVVVIKDGEFIPSAPTEPPERVAAG